jgi:protein SCO1/2/putative membrane protein
VGEFDLVGQDGAPRSSKDFAGEPWLFMSFFTRCAGPCPQMTLQMQTAQAELAGVPCHLVSLSVDPGHDTPEVLARYADDWEADPKRWTFLTGDEDVIYELLRERFSLGVARLREEDIDMGMQVTHASRLVVVDAVGRIRGWYDGESEDGRLAAVERVKSLAREAGLVATPYPLVNAVLNSLAALLLLAGWIVIRRPGAKTDPAARDRHANLMRAAFGVSTAFLVSYLYYHFVVVPELGHLGYRGTGAARAGYFALLLSHILLAIVNLPVVLRVLWLAHSERWEEHGKLAKIAWPMWMYVSVTGVLVYLLLYPLNPEIA